MAKWWFGPKSLRKMRVFLSLVNIGKLLAIKRPSVTIETGFVGAHRLIVATD